MLGGDALDMILWIRNAPSEAMRADLFVSVRQTAAKHVHPTGTPTL